MKAKSNVQNMSKEEINEFLGKQKLGTLSLTDGKSSYAIPLAYSYANNTVYLTLGQGGRKMEYINKSRNVCFSVHWIPENYGPTNSRWKSVICDGELEQIITPEGITGAIRVLEKHMGMPEGALNHILEMSLKKPLESSFWKVSVKNSGGKSVENFKEDFSE